MMAQEDLGPREGRGRIINVASMYGLVAPCDTMAHTAYTAAKHGLIGLTKALAAAAGGDSWSRMKPQVDGCQHPPEEEHCQKEHQTGDVAFREEPVPGPRRCHQPATG